MIRLVSTPRSCMRLPKREDVVVVNRLRVAAAETWGIRRRHMRAGLRSTRSRGEPEKPGAAGAPYLWLAPRERGAALIANAIRGRGGGRLAHSATGAQRS